MTIDVIGNTYPAEGIVDLTGRTKGSNLAIRSATGALLLTDVVIVGETANDVELSGYTIPLWQPSRRMMAGRISKQFLTVHITPFENTLIISTKMNRRVFHTVHQ